MTEEIMTLKECYDEILSKNTSYVRKRSLLQDLLARSVDGIKSNFLLLGFLADSVIHYKFGFTYLMIDYDHVTFTDYCKRVFGLEKSTVYAAISCYEQYCMQVDDEVFKLKPEFEDFSQSQLVEMLPLSYDQRKQIKPDMTIKQIREIKKQVLPKKEKKTAVSDPKEPEQISIDSDPDSGRLENSAPEKKDPIVIEAQEPQLSSKLVSLTNEKQRKEWLHNYEKWGVWLDVPPLKMKYYRYDFGNGDYCIVTVQELPDKTYNDGKHVLYSLVKAKGYPDTFHPGGNAQSMITDYLRETKVAVMQYD